MSTIKVGRAGTLSEANLQQIDLKGGTVRVTGNLHLADGSDLTYAAEQFAAYVDSPDETFVPVTWGTDCPPGFDGFYRVQDVALGSTQTDVWSLDLSLERVQGFAAPLFESVVIGSQRASSVAAQVTGLPWHAVPAAAVGYETGILTPTLQTFASETGNVSYFYGLTALPAATAAAATDLVTSTSHGLTVGDLVIFTALTGGAGLATNTWYYVTFANANTFKLSATKGGTAIDITTNATAATAWGQKGAGHYYNSRPTWYLAPADWYDGAASLTVGGKLVIGRQVPNNPTNWVLSNGIVRITGGTGGSLATELWSGTAWGNAGSAWRIGRKIGTGSYTIDPLGAPHTITVLRNDPACVTVRLAYDAAALVPGSRFVVYVDFTLRRGASVVEVTLSTRGAYTWGFQSSLVYDSLALGTDSWSDGTFVACGTSEFSQAPDANGKSHFYGLYAEGVRQFDQWGWGYLNGQPQAFVASQFAAAQAERVQVIAR